MADFTPVPSLIGGLLIGASASLLLLGLGRIAGVCGILGSLLDVPRAPDAGWRTAFILGLAFAGLVGFAVWPGSVTSATASPPMLVLAGLLVGYGTRLGNGCTSGHGVCGIARGSIRSIVATCTFMLTGAITVFVLRHVVGK